MSEAAAVVDLSAEALCAALNAAIPGCQAVVVPNGSPSAQHSLLLDHAHAVEAARWLRDHADYRLDYCTCVAGVDWLPSEKKDTVKVTKIEQTPEGPVEKQGEETRITLIPGYLEAVYHLYSVEKKHGPVILRLRTADRVNTRVPSLTPVWRSAEFQEREAFDLYGIIFDGHPDLRRILMWDSFTDHPMRKDYMPPPGEDEDAQL